MGPTWSLEKEGVVIQISSFSNGIRIALLNTRGFLVEYASKLARLAKEKGCNIAILVDWDVSGLLIYLKVKKIIPSLKVGSRLSNAGQVGAGCPRRGREIPDANENNHFDAVKRELKEAIQRIQLRIHRTKQALPEYSEYLEDIAYLASHLDYLEKKRIEINSITALLDDNTKFWSLRENDLRDAFEDRLFCSMNSRVCDTRPFAGIK